LEQVLSSTPGDNLIEAKLAETIFWQGSVAEKDGRYADALTHYREVEARLDVLRRDESAVTKWRYRAAEARGHVARILSITGLPEEAVQRFQDALAVLESAPDPANQQWSSVDLAMQLEQAIVLDYLSRTPDRARIAKLRGDLEALLARQPKSRPAIRWFAMSLQLESRIAGASPEQRLLLIQRARSVLAPLAGENTVDSMIEGEFARACLLEGRLEARAGRLERARDCWLSVATLLEKRAANSCDWRIIDPLAQALVLLGRDESARPFIETLKRRGYRPMDPDAASTLHLNH
jgi:serine/threonine-protein kinase